MQRALRLLALARTRDAFRLLSSLCLVKSYSVSCAKQFSICSGQLHSTFSLYDENSDTNRHSQLGIGPCAALQWRLTAGTGPLKWVNKKGQWWPEGYALGRLGPDAATCPGDSTARSLFMGCLHRAPQAPAGGFILCRAFLIAIQRTCSCLQTACLIKEEERAGYPVASLLYNLGSASSAGARRYPCLLGRQTGCGW